MLKAMALATRIQLSLSEDINGFFERHSSAKVILQFLRKTLLAYIHNVMAKPS